MSGGDSFKELEDGFIVPDVDPFGVLPRDRKEKNNLYEIYRGLNEETMEYLTAVHEKDVLKPGLIAVDGMTVKFTFDYGQKPTAGRTGDMEVTKNASLLDRPVPPRHVLVVMVDLDGTKISAGAELEHPHCCVLVRTSEGSWILESNTHSEQVLRRHVYCPAKLGTLLHVPQTNFILNKAQSVSQLEICNAFSTLIVVLVMVNWSNFLNGENLCRRITRYMNTLDCQTSRKVYQWLLHDFSADPDPE
jgi:hypothetical protein